jgi:hypothetical protein
MLKEYAVVRLKEPDPSIPIPPGAKGAVLIVYDSSPPAYEVEFVDDAGKSLGAYTVGEKHLEEIK